MVGPARGELTGELEDTGELNSFWVSIDKTALDPTSGTGELGAQGLNVTWLSKGADRGDRQLVLGATGAGPATVTVSGKFGPTASDTLTVVFNPGGFIVVRNLSGTVKERFALRCPNKDAITMILTSQQ